MMCIVFLFLEYESVYGTFWLKKFEDWLLLFLENKVYTMLTWKGVIAYVILWIVKFIWSGFIFDISKELL
mgnify:CR=1 FL=1